MPDASKNPPSRRRPWRRRLGIAALGALLLAAGVVAAADWWLPALVARVIGLESAARETRWGDVVSWREARWADGNLAITAGLVRLDAPSRIALAGGVASSRIEDWELVVEATSAATTDEDAAAGTPFGWPELHAALTRTGRELERWVGEVELQRGRVLVAGETIELPALTVKGGRASGSLAWRGEAVDFDLELPALGLSLRVPARDLRLDLRAASSERIAGALVWTGNEATLDAEFAAGDWRPRALVLAGREWAVQAELFGRGAEYGALRGGFVARLVGDSVSVTVDALAAPRAEDFPPVKIIAEASADTERFSLARLELAAPGLDARLSAPIVWRRGQGWAMTGEPEFAWSAGLAELSAGRVSGRLAGAARWRDDGVARVEWEARAEGLAWADYADVSAELRGVSTAEETRVSGVEARLANGARLRASGRYLHAEKRVENGEFEAEALGEQLARWMPAGWRVERVQVVGTVAGGLTALAVEARAEASAGAARLELAGAWKNGRDAVVLERAALTRTDGATLRLVRPGLVEWTRGARSLDLGLTGERARLDVVWREGDKARVGIDTMDTSWLDGWRTGVALPPVAVRELALAGRVDTAGWLTGEARLELSHAESGWLRVEGAADVAGVALRRLELGQAGEVLAAGEGVVPWRWRAGDDKGPVPVDGVAWALRLESRAKATLWDDLAKLAGLELEGPALRVVLDGPAREPAGRLELAAERIVLRGEGTPQGGLELRGLVASGSLTPGGVAVERLAATVDGQRVEASGRVALAEGDWARLQARPWAFLRDRAEARISLPEAQVAALARYLPTLLAPTGTVAAELRLTPGANLDGTLRLNGGATRPLGAFGVLQQIDVELALAGLDVRIARMRAQAGGQAVEITGGARRDPGRMPALDLRVRAERFPLVRRPGLLLRGDLDLAIVTREGRTRLSGGVDLRDSLFLADIRPLVASGGGGGGGAPARPPYFSVDTPPLADWELAVRVGGKRFLRLRTPVFAGVASARFDLAGNLREPRAVGEAWVEEGSILFPFASFAVQTGAVRLRAGDPYTPLLEFRASGRRLGYDLRLELAGTAEAPQLQLFSSPPLEAERLLLMITAGAAPLDGQGAASTTQRLAAVGAYVGRDLLRTLGVASSDEERLTLHSGERVSRQGRETFGFEFKLNDKWSLAGDYDEFDAYNAGLRRRLQGRPPQAEGETREDNDAR